MSNLKLRIILKTISSVASRTTVTYHLLRTVYVSFNNFFRSLFKFKNVYNSNILNRKQSWLEKVIRIRCLWWIMDHPVPEFVSQQRLWVCRYYWSGPVSHSAACSSTREPIRLQHWNGQRLYNYGKSVPIRAWKCNFKEIMTKRPTNQQVDAFVCGCAWRYA